MRLSLGVSLVAYARAVGGVWLVSPLPGMWACVSLHVGLYVGVWVVVCLRMPCLWAWFIWLVCLLAFVGFLYRADAPSPIL